VKPTTDHRLVAPYEADTAPDTSPEPDLPAAEVASVLEVTLRTLTRWEENGRLIPVRRNGRRYYPVAAVRALWEMRIGIVRYEWDEQIE
jgi:hypothetical protein